MKKGYKTGLCFCMALLLGMLFTGCRNNVDKNNSTGNISSSSGGTMSSTMPSPSASASPTPSSELPEESSYSLEDMYEKIKDTYGERYYPNQQIEADELDKTFGIGEDLYDDFIADRVTGEEAPDTLVIIKAKEGKEDEVKQKLEDYRQKLLDDANWAESKEKIEASQVYTNGQYVFYVMLGDVDDDTLSGEGLMEALGKEVDKGIGAIRNFFTGNM